MSVQKGDQITVVTMNGNVLRAVVENLFTNPDDRDGFRWYTSWAYSEHSYFAEEGTGWICGYHEDDSEAVRALKAAAAMASSTKPARPDDRAFDRYYKTSYTGGGD